MRRPAPRHLLSPLPALLAIAALLCLGGCGGGGQQSLVQIQGSSPSQAITPAMLDHWMRTMAGGDFRSNIGTKGPEGLVAEPENQPECVAAAKKIVPRSFTGRLKLSEAQLQQKCSELYRSIKAQAISYLISAQWAIAEGAEQGLKVSEAQVRRQFAVFRKGPYPTEADLRAYLQEHRWSLSDVLYQLKRNILVHELLPAFEAKVKAAGGGEAAYARLARERYKRLVARTSCKPGYVAPGCREYHGPPVVTPTPNALLEAFTQGR